MGILVGLGLGLGLGFAIGLGSQSGPLHKFLAMVVNAHSTECVCSTAYLSTAW